MLHNINIARFFDIYPVKVLTLGKQTIDICICDDHQIFRGGLKAALEDADHVNVCMEASNGAECLEMLEERLPDLIFMDLSMPVMNGIECVKIVKEKYPTIKVIALTQYDQKRFVKQMLKYGADGYIIKSTSQVEILMAINTVMNDRIYIAEKAQVELNNLKKSDTTDLLFPDLSSREKAVLKLICEGNSSREIGEKLAISHYTVETHRSNLLKKTGSKNLASMITWAVNNGFDA